MASTAAKPPENPDMSMEDILQSIRKIIAEDEPPAGAGASGQEASFGSDVLELTELVEEPTPEAAPAADTSSSLDIMQHIEEATATPAAPEPVAAEPVEPTPVALAPAPVATAAAPVNTTASPLPANIERLISDTVASASAASLKRVIETHKATSSMPHFRTGSTIEDLVLETLKPILKEWLDTNLPAMVERIVEREIRKLVE